MVTTLFLRPCHIFILQEKFVTDLKNQICHIFFEATFFVKAGLPAPLPAEVYNI